MSDSGKHPEKIALVVPVSHTHYVVPPVGLGYLATSLLRNDFPDIVILDCLKEGLSYNGLRSRLKQLKPGVIGFQVFSCDFDSVVKSIDIVKQVSPETVTLVGGPHVSATGALALEEIKGADFGFAGEAEPGLPLLLKRLLRNDKVLLEDIPGLIWRERDSVRSNPRVKIDDLDKLGFPAWHLMPPAAYPDNPQGAFYKKFPIAPISTTRGCPYRCTFCGSGVNMGRELRTRSMENVLDEMGMLYRDFGVREFHVIDDMFSLDRERVVKFCQGIKERKWNISYTFPNGLRLNQLDEEMLKIMKETGAYAFTVGIESGSQRVLDMMKKDLTLELIRQKVDLINSAGLDANGFFIIGYPGEGVGDIEATIRFAKGLKLKHAHFSNFLPLPGTEATRKLIDSGEIKKTNWSSLSYSKVSYTPKGITERQLKRLQRRAFLEFHLRPHILLKMLSEIRSFNHFKLILRRIMDYLFLR